MLEPAVLSVTLKVPTPFVRFADCGSSAEASEETIETRPLYPTAVLPDASRAVTVKVMGDPAVAFVGTELSTSWDAAEGFTVMEPLVVVRLPSAAVMVRLPTVLRVTWKDLVPLVRVDALGRFAEGSLDVMATVPVYPVAVFPLASLAVTVMVEATPETTLAGTELKASVVAAPGFTVTFALVPTVFPSMVAPMVTTPEFNPVKLVV